MKIDYLEKLNFLEIAEIEELKTSRGKVVFENYGETLRLSSPDLRYYWDGMRFGLHVSDFENYIFAELWHFFKKEELFNKIEIIYFSRCNISAFNYGGTTLNSLTFFNLSQNSGLQKIALFDTPKLTYFNASNCPKLTKLELNGDFSKVEKIDLSNSLLKELTIENWQNLEYLNLENNQILELDISNLPNLKYLFVKGHNQLNLIWPSKWNLNELSILGVDKSNQKINADIIEIAKISSDSELREKIQSFLKLRISIDLMLREGETSINRHQIMLIGNSTSGKSELRCRFLNKKRQISETSTHGVIHFNKRLDDGSEVIGYDFGGQDYYHSIHLPFFDEFTHYIIVIGNNSNIAWGNYDSDNFYGNIDSSGNENLFYPINYWIKSILQPLKYQHLSNIFPESSFSFEDHSSYHKPIVDIVQNHKKGTSELFLNQKNLKANESLIIGATVAFDFKEKKVGNWLIKRIKSLPKEVNTILIAVIRFGENLKANDKTIYSSRDLEVLTKEKNPHLDDENVKEFIESLVRNRYLFYPGKKNPKLDGFYIIHIDKFTEYLYQVLSKEWTNNNPDKGYFLKAEGLKRIKNATDEEKEFVIQFLLDSEIIFEVQNSEDNNPHYVAPSYLPEPQLRIEKLFIDSFENPDCKFEFHEFFHANVIHQVFKKYQKFILKDDKSKNNNEKVRYLIWKNCIIMYNSNSSDKEIKGSKPKDFLKLELLLPNKENQERIPTFTIARNNAGKVENDQFSKVFSEIKELLNKYSPKILVKTPYTTLDGESEYIDFKDVERADNLSEGKNKKSAFISSNNVLYYKHDFRHFHKNMKAPLKIFIAYSKYDDDYRKELRDHLNPGIVEGTFIVFDDREMDMGEKWHARLKKELEQCDIFIVLISVKTLSTPYVMNVEIPEAIKRFGQKRLNIIPILISECDWPKTGLTGFNVFDKAESITTSNNYFDLSAELRVNDRAKKWTEIVKYLENLTPNGNNPTNGPTPPDEPISGAD